MNKENLIYGVMIILILIISVASCFSGKNLSYQWFYEDMVKETIREIVKKQSLK